MKTTFGRLLAAFAALVIASCGTQKKSADVQTWQDYYDSIDTAAVAYDYVEDEQTAIAESYASLPLRGSYPLVNDLVHTKLDVRFDWDKERLMGKAWLTLAPHFYSTDSLSLDAKGMFIHKLELVGKTNQPLLYAYDDSLHIKIKLDKTYKAGERYTVYIEYTARPKEYGGVGSAAITSAQGLYFIDPKDTDPTKPRQLWTQGETESNSVWFPTIDKPNAKTTLELAMTVDTGFVTLSNGAMTSSKRNADGTRTDTWKMDKAFAPYLVMMAAGKFAVVKDKWRNIPVDYYVDPEFARDAKAVFGNTPEMLSFFSDRFGDYPWNKYAQVVVHDFVSGAMENVTASVFYDQLHATKRELLDENHDDIIAHELSHHWFGDLVTIESWSDLPLNESFATYCEVLWMRHKYGNDEADFHANNDLINYLAEAETKQVPLIRYRYAAPEDMFDAHSYQKGGRVLLMLNDLVGDSAFYASLRLYLTQHRYGAVELDDLRLAFEKTTGKDLRWFFDQWFRHAGHPVVSVQSQYVEAANAVIIRMQQSPSGYENMPTHWRLPMAVDLHFPSGVKRHAITFDNSEQEFVLPAYEAPLLVNVDANKKMLWNKTENKPLQQYLYQYRNGNYLDRYEALQRFAELQSENDTAANALVGAVDDKFWRLRDAAVEAVDMNDQMTPRVRGKLEQLAKSDPRSLVRAVALIKLSQTADTALVGLFLNALRDSSYTVMAQGLSGLNELAPERAAREAKALMQEKNTTVAGAVMYVLAASRDTTLHDYFLENIARAPSAERFSAVMTYGRFLATLPFSNSSRKLGSLYKMAVEETQWFVRYAAISALFDVRTAWDAEVETLGMELNALNSGDARYTDLKQQVEQRKAAIETLNQRIAAMKEKETNEMLRSIME
ncbi:MAG TPA: M1 family metallopeptidase [Chitinophagales bacterium]|nr:M1 family metallopeptidase [Chitinophagales bacterium]